ncbi:myosin light chain kinase family member 4 isoform X1 [Trichosurus vulpecula]|uniref:myosin light chain kinase family member 4 isoform X1 n=1 Tax=Trichosurus vulpecula TaxID=9337 RepID=UPI00186AEAAB|nr:myosin light chain kinase family member 4 isoform X1 [Trichosurus vulpecula]
MGGKQKKLIPVNDNLQKPIQEAGEIKGRDYAMIYKSEVKRDENHTPDSSLIRLTSKMLKMNRLEDINACYNSNLLEKMAYFQCVEKGETLQCFLKENTNELDSGAEENEAKETVWHHLSLKETCVTKKRTLDPTERSAQKNQACSDKEKIHKLNKENAEKACTSFIQEGSPRGRFQNKVEDFTSREECREDTIGKDSSKTGRQEEVTIRGDNQDIVEKLKALGDVKGSQDSLVFKREKNVLHAKGDASKEETGEEGSTSTINETVKRLNDNIKNNSPAITRGGQSTRPLSQNAELAALADHSSKRRVNDGSFLVDDKKKSRVDREGTDEKCKTKEPTKTKQSLGSLLGKFQETPRIKNGHLAKPTAKGKALEKPFEDAPAPPAPFDHRIVTTRQIAINSLYTVNRREILGGGRFGQVHKCEEKSTGLKLAAKIIKTRGVKEKDEVMNEISVMNQLDHVNLIQLYDAFESKNDIVLVMEYVDGGELFDRIIDENCNLSELDTILFIKQICEGIKHMHQMYILHLDLKPENILCVNRDAKQIKIIDFGLARRYSPREKLKVNFGTPEFLAPEVVNYDFVSFPTDMWSIGVIAYMLLSGLSPFLGDNDAETLNNILACRWDLDEEEFQDTSEEGKEFISKLLIKEKSWRISASEALKHPWLSDHSLHRRLSSQKKKNQGSKAQ